jgi:hypothetical protein
VFRQFGDHGFELFGADAAVEVRIETDRIGQRIVARRQALGPIDLFECCQVTVAIRVGLPEGGCVPASSFRTRDLAVSIGVKAQEQPPASDQPVGRTASACALRIW